ncbi:MAG TPA: hypothetical protein VFO08_15030 [Methylomirabilota bacterium]|nr:hypothetical protein [Methylomirabilota bacterium]
MRGIDQALVDEVWREITSYPPGRIEQEAREFLERQPEVAAFAHTVAREHDPAVQRASLGLCFLVFKIVERSLGRPFPRLEESRLRAAHTALTEWLAGLEDDSARILAAAGAPGHPTLAAHLVSVFYGEGAEGCDERVRAGLLLMLRTLTDALDLGPVEA